MIITIWDTDWCANKESFPNIYCMKLSSYHQQLGDTINFVDDDFKGNLVCDKRYIFREKDSTPLPPKQYIDAANTILLGRGFRYYNVKQVSMTVAACRPDYLLYGLNKNSIFENSNFLLFYHNGKRIPLSQDYHNTLSGRKKNLVVDKTFWKANDDDLIWCLDFLAQEKNIAFLDPISLKRILTNKTVMEKFLNLNFTTATNFKWKNDYGSEPDEVTRLVEFLTKLKSRTHSAIGTIPIKLVQCNQFEEEDGWKIDLIKALRTVKYCREKGINCELVLKPNDLCAYPWLFNTLSKWSKAKYKISFVEYVLAPICLEKGISWSDILNNSLKWSNAAIDNLIGLLTESAFQNEIDLFFCGAKNTSLNKNLINWEIIKQKAKLTTKGEQNE